MVEVTLDNSSMVSLGSSIMVPYRVIINLVINYNITTKIIHLIEEHLVHVGLVGGDLRRVINGPVHHVTSPIVSREKLERKYELG